MTHTTAQPNDVINYKGTFYIIVNRLTIDGNKRFELYDIDNASYYSILQDEAYEVVSDAEIKQKFPFLIY